MQTSSVVLIAAVLLAMGLAVPVVERSIDYINQANRDVSAYRNQTAVQGLGVGPEMVTAAEAEEALLQAQLAIGSAKEAISKGETTGANVSEARSLVEEAQQTLDAGLRSIDHGNYQEAYSMGLKAKMLADQAEQSVTQQLRDMAEEALRAIESAEETIRRAEYLQGSLNSTSFRPLSQAGVLSSRSLISFQSDQPPSPEDLLSQAEELLTRAKVAYQVRDFGEAIILAQEAERLAQTALDQLLHPSVPVTQAEALTAVARAKTAEIAACERVGYAASYFVDVGVLMDQLGRASQILDEANVFLQEGEYAQARANAIQSWRIFEIAERSADELARQAEATLKIMPDPFPPGVGGPVEVAEDESGNLVVQAEKHSVTIQRSSPALSYSVDGDGGAASFEANLFALIEFADGDSDDEIDENEIVKVLQLGSLEWRNMPQNTTRGEETTLELWYNFEDAEHNVWMAMKAFETPTLQYFSVGDNIVMWFVDGNAREVKLDLIVEKWPWISLENKLALRLLVSLNEEGIIQTREVGVEKWVGIAYENTTVRIKSTMKAVVFAGSQTMVDVAMNSKELPGGEIQVDFVYPNFGLNRLVHDPSLGIGGPFAYEPILNTLSMVLGTAIIGIVVFASRKRLEKLSLHRA